MIGVRVVAGPQILNAEDLAAEALADVLARDGREDMAVLEDGKGAYLIVSYAEYRVRESTYKSDRWKLRKACRRGK